MISHSLNGARRRRRCAFSLVEVIVVLSIIGMFAVVAVPRFGQFSAQQRLSAAANRLETDLKLAQRHARFTSSSMIARFHTSSDRYELIGMSDPNHPSQPYVVDLKTSPYEVRIVSAVFGNDDKLVYDGFGAPDSNGAVTLAVGGLQRTLTFDGPNITIGTPEEPTGE
jgi:prepilin-type N-terminal cleavage/methylation domain-containing protein